MSAKTVDLKGFIKELGGMTKDQIPLVRQAVAGGVARSIPTLVEASPVDTGLYAQSWDMTVQEMSVTLGNYAPHAGVIENGARPFKPPIGPLLAWAKRVTGDSSQPDSGGGYSSRVWALALHTQRKIEAEGMQPKHILENAIPEIIENIKKELKLLG